MTLFMASRANEAGYAITAQDFFAELHFDPSKAPSKQAFADARKKIRWSAFEYLLHEVHEARRDELERPWRRQGVFEVL
jgi:3-deoxy-D-manno-octulosonic acid (KDO) 8-phosphate synthase